MFAKLSSLSYYSNSNNLTELWNTSWSGSTGNSMVLCLQTSLIATCDPQNLMKPDYRLGKQSTHIVGRKISEISLFRLESITQMQLSFSANWQSFRLYTSLLFEVENSG